MTPFQRFIRWAIYWCLAVAGSAGLAAVLLAVTDHTVPGWLDGRYGAFLNPIVLNLYRFDALGAGLIAGLAFFWGMWGWFRPGPLP